MASGRRARARNRFRRDGAAPRRDADCGCRRTDRRRRAGDREGLVAAGPGNPSRPRWRDLASDHVAAGASRVATRRSRTGRVDSDVSHPVVLRLMKRLLIVEDKESLALMLKETVEADGLEAEISANGSDASRRIAEGRRYFAVLTDLRLPGADGIAVLKQGKDTDPDCPVIVMTAFGTIENAV